jgi:hypothetical protein
VRKANGKVVAFKFVGGITLRPLLFRSLSFRSGHFGP